MKKTEKAKEMLKGLWPDASIELNDDKLTVQFASPVQEYIGRADVSTYLGRTENDMGDFALREGSFERDVKYWLHKFELDDIPQSEEMRKSVKKTADGLWKVAEAFEMKEVTDPQVKKCEPPYDRAREVLKVLNDHYKERHGHGRYAAAMLMDPDIENDVGRTSLTGRSSYPVEIERMCMDYGEYALDHNAHNDITFALREHSSKQAETRALAEESLAAYIYTQAEADMAQHVMEDVADEVCAPEMERAEERDELYAAMDAVARGHSLAGMENVQKCFMKTADASPKTRVPVLDRDDRRKPFDFAPRAAEAGKRAYIDVHISMPLSKDEIRQSIDEQASYMAKNTCALWKEKTYEDRADALTDAFGKKAHDIMNLKDAVITSKGDVRIYSDEGKAQLAGILGCDEKDIGKTVSKAFEKEKETELEK